MKKDHYIKRSFLIVPKCPQQHKPYIGILCYNCKTKYFRR